MSVLDKKPLSDEIKDLMVMLRFDNFPVELLGSSSFKYQNYYGDYDFFTVVRSKSSTHVLKTMNQIIKRITDNPNCYITEIKIETENGDKIRYHPPDVFIDAKQFKKLFKDLKMIKIDFIIFSNNRFLETSIIYQFGSSEYSEKDHEKEMKKEIKEWVKDNNYFKALKRVFSLKSIDEQKNKKLLIHLTNLFNSEIGSLYSIKSNMEAIELMKDSYGKDAIVKKKIAENLKSLKPFNLSDYNDIVKKINDVSKKYMNKYIK
jgi:hypothetical protein